MARKPLALFIDAENQQDLDLDALLQRLERQGYDVCERHAVADWAAGGMRRLAWQCQRAGVRMHHTCSGPERPGEIKDLADHGLSSILWSTMPAHPEIETVVIVSGDHYFASIARALQARGARVIVVSDICKLSLRLCLTADEVIPLGEGVAWLRELERLAAQNKYLTFSFVVGKSALSPDVLSQLIEVKMVLQDPRRVRRARKIHIDYQHPVTQAVLGLKPRIFGTGTPQQRDRPVGRTLPPAMRYAVGRA